MRPSTKVLLLVLVAASPAVFALVTGNIWEDFFITYRCSLNLVHGHGLVYEAGRRVHAFTSPLGTLLPAAISWGLRTDDPLAVLVVFRGLACAALAGAWWFAWPRLPGMLGLLLATALGALDAKLAAYATNGMETALLVLAVVAAWRFLVDARWDAAGVALGAAMWVRPDGFVFVGACTLGCLLFPGGPRPPLRAWLRAGGIAAALYLPWVAWAWWYYGSPVPNTILAKGSGLHPGEMLGLLASYPWRFVAGHCAAHDAFLPPYFFFGDWPDWIAWFGRLLSIMTAAVIFWPGAPRPARIAAVAFVVGGLYLSLTARAPWYFPTWAMLAYLALGGAVSAGWERTAGAPRWRWLLGLGVVALVAVQGWLYVSVAAELRAQQQLIEWDQRARIGLDLRKAARSPRDTVFLEPLGYIGYFSGLAMRDTPGLCAPEVIALRRSGAATMAATIAALRPDWAVLRAGEVAGMSESERQQLGRDYSLWRTYDARSAVAAVAWLPGRAFLSYDAQFLVWRRNDRGRVSP